MGSDLEKSPKSPVLHRVARIIPPTLLLRMILKLKYYTSTIWKHVFWHLSQRNHDYGTLRLSQFFKISGKSQNWRSDWLLFETRCGMVHIGPVASSGIFRKFASRLLPDGWVELKISGCRYHFRTFQLELDTLGTKNFEIGTVVKKLQMFEVGRILKIREIPTSPFWSATMILMICYNLRNEHSVGLK